VCCRQGSNAAGGDCTTRRQNAHRTEERKVLYTWHPWAGCIVHIHEVIEKAAGDVARCSHDDGASGRLLELPIWMFDRSACAPMRVEAFPRVDIAALRALRLLLGAAAIGGVALGVASSNAPDSGAARASHDRNRGEVHATPTAASTRPSKRDAAVRFIRHGERRQLGTDAGMADAASANAPGADGAADAPHLRSRGRRSTSPTEEGAP
jgi:hypothetical protein